MTASATQLPFQEAIDFLKGKVNIPTKRWDDLLRQAQVRGFTVAGMMRDDWLSEIRAAVEKARAEGTGFQDFQKTFNEFVDRSGWQFNARGKTEEERRAWRARIIYKTNMRVSYMAGRYKQMSDPDVLKYRPYWQYKHSDSVQHPRPLHLEWDGRIYLATDKWWDTHFGPNGWGCECWVLGLSKRQLAAMGKDGPDPSPPDDSYQDTDPRTGQPETRFPGIDRGWEYNPGKEWLEGSVPPELHQPLSPIGAVKPAGLPPLPEPRPSKADLLADGLSGETYVRKFMGAFDLKSAEVGYHRDPSGGIVTISRSLFEQRDPQGRVVGLKATKFDRGRFALLLADAIKDPDEIWADWATNAAGTIVLRRSYVRRFSLGKSGSVFVRFEWSKSGWTAITAFDTKTGYLEKYRTGALLYRQK
jgi:hypothetical protein